ncbi:flagellar hook-associated protein FlgL [Pokkaliibacter sp. CJK22405]|uniref:flagellar hook-associated protein FlgL n=1 Tax=Pokkaliibacter sp. CJK22405 TaxID=3384615 RepID=UPI003984D873
MRISSQQLYRQGLTSIQKNQEELSRANDQLSTGMRVLTAGDDPAAATQASRLESKLAQSGQYQKNTTSLVNSLEYEESITDSVNTSMLRIKTLLIQAGNGGLDDTDKQAIATELQERLSEMQDLMNAKNSSGNYIFSGHATDTEAFTADNPSLSTTYQTYSYQGDSGQNEVPLSSYVSLSNGDAGDSVFVFDEVDGSGNATGNSTNILNVISEAATVLNDPTQTADLDKYLNNLESAYSQLQQTQSSIGARLNVADDVQSSAEASDITDTSTKASLVEVDTYEAITNLTTRTNALQIAQASYAKVQGMSLFDYL